VDRATGQPTGERHLDATTTLIVLSLMADPNWLFSACAQTAGAIVAIVGGFLATRLVTLNSERNSLSERIRIVSRRLDDARQRRADAQRKLRKWEEKHFSNAIVRDIVDQKGAADAAQLADTHKTWDIPHKRLPVLVEHVQEQCITAFSVFRKSPGAIQHTSFDEMTGAMTQQLSGLDREIFRQVYHEVSREQAEHIRNPITRMATLESPLLSVSMPSMEETQLKLGERTMAQQQIETASLDENSAKMELEILTAQLVGLQRPWGLRYAWSILAYMTVVGVALPLGLLPSGERDAGLKWVVLGPFFLGLGLLLHYFAQMFRQGKT